MQDPRNLRQQMEVEASALKAIEDEIRAARGRIAEAHQQIEAATRAIAETEKQIEQLHQRSEAIEKRKALLEQYLELLKQEVEVASTPRADAGEASAPQSSRDPATNDNPVPAAEETSAPESGPEYHLASTAGPDQLPPAANGDGAFEIATDELSEPAAGHERAAEGFVDLDDALLDTDLGELPGAQASEPRPATRAAAVDEEEDSKLDFEHLGELKLSTEILPRTQTFEEELLLLMAYHRKALRVRDVIRTFRRLDYTPKIIVDKAIKAHVEGNPQFFEHVAEGRYVLTDDGRSEADRLLRQLS